MTRRTMRIIDGLQVIALAVALLFVVVVLSQ
jgi:hypothetical protein